MVGIAASGYKKPEQLSIPVENYLNSIEVETDEEHIRLHDKIDESVVKENPKKRNIKLDHPMIILCFFIFLALIYNIICLLLYKNFIPSCGGTVIYYFGFNHNKSCYKVRIETDTLIGINNTNAIENIRDEDTETSISDMYSEQQEYDYKIEYLKGEDSLSETETAFKDTYCANVPEKLRFDCHPENGASQLSCTQRGCCWNPLGENFNTRKRVPLNIPYCYYPEKWNLYKYINFTQNGNDFSGYLRQEKNSAYKNDMPLIKIEATGINTSILRVKV